MKTRLLKRFGASGCPVAQGGLFLLALSALMLTAPAPLRAQAADGAVTVTFSGKSADAITASAPLAFGALESQSYDSAEQTAVTARYVRLSVAEVQYDINTGAAAGSGSGARGVAFAEFGLTYQGEPIDLSEATLDSAGHSGEHTAANLLDGSTDTKWYHEATTTSSRPRPSTPMPSPPPTSPTATPSPGPSRSPTTTPPGGASTSATSAPRPPPPPSAPPPRTPSPSTSPTRTRPPRAPPATSASASNSATRPAAATTPPPSPSAPSTSCATASPSSPRTPSSVTTPPCAPRRWPAPPSC